MKTSRLFYLLAVFFMISIAANAQDTIRTKKSIIVCKVLEIGLDEIKYKDFDNLDGPVIVIEKRTVIEITYANGKKEFITGDPYDASKEIEVRHKTHAVKFEFFSPLGNDIAFSYETMVKVGMNLEFKVAAIGPGFNENPENASGVWVKAGVKFLTSPTYYIRGVKYAHGLKGGYIKPEIIYSAFVSDGINFQNGAINIVFGKQHVLGNVITLDYYAGLGYGFQTNDLENQYGNYYDDSYYLSYAYSHLYMSPQAPLVLTGGFTIGYLF